MEPNKRFISSVTDGNLWIYILSLGKEQEVQQKETSRLIFEKFGFLPNELMVRTVLFRLKNDGYISKEKLKSEKAYKTTDKGIKELENTKNFCQNLLLKI
ncbi:MAG: PadR family transcriptional regulator [Candidatus Pacebacteria bacterium]|nr:PadR family transcriptional regulator [Candidatus Paceibacterota bacterium]